MLQLSAEFFLLSSLSRSWVLRGKVRRGAEVRRGRSGEVQRCKYAEVLVSLATLRVCRIFSTISEGRRLEEPERPR